MPTLSWVSPALELSAPKAMATRACTLPGRLKLVAMDPAQPLLILFQHCHDIQPVGTGAGTKLQVMCLTQSPATLGGL